MCGCVCVRVSVYLLVCLCESCHACMIMRGKEAEGGQSLCWIKIRPHLGDQPLSVRPIRSLINHEPAALRGFTENTHICHGEESTDRLTHTGAGGETGRKKEQAWGDSSRRPLLTLNFRKRRGAAIGPV